MAWATPEQLAAYLGVDEADLEPTPEQAARLLERASEFLDMLVLGRYDPATALDAVVARMVRATCAQVEYWMSTPDQLDTGDVSGGGIAAYSAGSLQVTYANGSQPGGRSASNRLAPRAKDALFMAGMLSRAVSVRSGYGVYE